jgi:hypothetical protein
LNERRTRNDPAGALDVRMVAADVKTLLAEWPE